MRGTETPEQLQVRLRNAEIEMAASPEYDYVVVNEDGKIDETGSLGEALNSCAADKGEGITSGSVGWTTLTLAPGHYEIVCNLTNHYADHMYQGLVVT